MKGVEMFTAWARLKLEDGFWCAVEILADRLTHTQRREGGTTINRLAVSKRLFYNKSHRTPRPPPQHTLNAKHPSTPIGVGDSIDNNNSQTDAPQPGRR